MVTPISEEDARTALRRATSEASNPEYFHARRRERGWLFGWRPDRRPVPMGTHSWIVADNGAVRMLGYKDLADEVIAHELAR